MAVEERGQQATRMAGGEPRGEPVRGGSARPGLPSVLAVLWMAGISWLSSQPDSSLPDLWEFAGDDKAEHLAFYTVLGLLLWWAFRAHRRAANAAGRWTMLAGGLFAATDEIHQRFVPTRRCEWTDWAADILGVIIGAAVGWMIWRSAARRRGEGNHVANR